MKGPFQNLVGGEDLTSQEEYVWCVKNYTNMVLRIAVNYCKQMEDAQDLVQEVFLKLLQYKKRFKDEEHRKYWIIRVTVNLCKNYLHSGYKQKVQYMDHVSMQELLELSETEQDCVSETNERVFQAVTALPEKLRIVVYLFYYEEYSVKEIAEILKKSETAILTRLHRARKKMKENLEGVWQDE